MYNCIYPIKIGHNQLYQQIIYITNMLKGIMVGPKSIVYKPWLPHLIWMKIGTTTSVVQKIREKLHQLIHAHKGLLLKFHAIWTSTTTSTKMASYMVYCHLNILSIVKSVKPRIYYFFTFLTIPEHCGNYFMPISYINLPQLISQELAFN